MIDLNIPDAAVPYILLQRTNLQRWNPKAYPLLRKLPLNYESLLLPLESRARGGAVKAGFAHTIAEDYAAIKQHLPATASAILDIGCGVAGIDAPLYHYYGGKALIYLLDRTQTDRAGYEYGMGAVERFYNSLELAKSLLITNRVQPEHIVLMDAVPGFTLPTDLRLDLVISLISWGFHYPVETYLDQVHNALNPGGRLILDVRKGHSGEDLLRGKFGDLRVIYEDGKHARCLLVRA